MRVVRSSSYRWLLRVSAFLRILSFIPGVVIQSADATPLSVCELIGNLNAYADQEVVVRGEVVANDWFLVLKTDDCDEKFSLNQFVWPSAVNLAPHLDIEIPEATSLRRTIAEAFAVRKYPRLTATFAGTSYVVGRSIPTDSIGFGPGYTLPAELRFRSITDVAIQLEPAPDEMDVVSVCELLSNLKTYAGKRVAVRGQTFSGYHGSGLFDDCPSPILVDGLNLPPSIHLSSPGYLVRGYFPDYSELRGRPVETSAGAVDLSKGRYNVQKWITHVGIVRAREKYESHCMENRLRVFGFGHLNYAPVELLRETSMDFKVIPESGFAEPVRDEDPPPCPRPERASEFECGGVRDLHMAVERGCSERVRFLVSNVTELGRTSERYKALQIAAASGYTDIAKILLDAAAEPNHSESGNSPLCMAVEQAWNAEMAGYLLSRGATPNPRTSESCVPLAKAAKEGHREIARLLLAAGARADVQDSGGSPVLHAAVRGGDVEIVRLLLGAGANVNDRDRNGAPALADSRCQGDILTLLLESGADVNVQDNIGKTPLMEACAYRQRSKAIALLAAGAEPNRTDRNGNTALMYAVKSGFVDCIDVLLDRGADPNLKNASGKTAVMLADGPNARYMIEALNRGRN